MALKLSEAKRKKDAKLSMLSPPASALLFGELQQPIEYLLPQFSAVSCQQHDSGTEDPREEEEEEFTSRKRESYGGKKEDINYDKDPEFADILGDCLDNPEKAQKKMEERLRNKRNKILHTKTGSATSMQVTFNKFEYSNSYMWLEFHNAPLDKDIALITDAIRSWHILGRLGGYNSMNMQLSQAPVDKRPNYDAILGANIEPTTFYNIGDLEVQDNVARICYVGIKKVVFGGSEFENWKENLTSEESGFRVHKI
ncbi:hypothetical protein F2Q68_00029274 [Brassica cretica]|uniref:Uncharacterized protein n=1 Tax=Brassica cretica TaxID=69181 RepID=A0A8S9G8C1_BRACR|nr:hypothetical protein F2Q68_00029274 [Brassica cretica]